MRSRPLDDEQLIKTAKSGSIEAFGMLYERYADPIYRYISSHLDNRLDAEDLTEEIFIRAWKALPGYDERGLPFSAFLFRSARNSLIDFYRQKKPVYSLDDLELSSNHPDPENEVNDKIDNENLRQKLRQLREDYQAVLIFRFLSGLSPEETAQVMERSVGAIRVLQHRALAALKELIEKSENEQSR